MESGIRFVTFEDLKQRYGVPYTRQGLLALEKQGLWPKRSNIGPGRFGWTSRQIDERLEELARQSDQETMRARKAAAPPHSDTTPARRRKSARAG
jgi:predicted DNA-binding transcriptional regulator AlpA